MYQRLNPLSHQSVQIQGGFWGPKLATNQSRTLPAIYKQLKETGRITAMDLDWKEGQPNKPHIFFDSDVAKWIEAAAYSITHNPDMLLENQIDKYIDAMSRAQEADGYLNSYFQSIEPGKRWTNVRDLHELYCAGHLIEAAVAYFQATGKQKMLDIMCRYADYIDSIFGPGENQKHGYPGHQEIELALIKLYRITSEKRYLRLAKYFIDERGKQPYFFDVEAIARGNNPQHYRFYNLGNYAQSQAHLPVRQQTEVVGHAVRAMYMYAGMLDVAIETQDQSLIDTCRLLWPNLTERRMYITGGIGPNGANEGFTFDYDLPNESAYAETCAAIALAFWAHRMLQIEPNKKYADILERALYNGILSGVSLDGERFFYANPLANYPSAVNHKKQNETSERQPWFSCACCPPNLARILASLGGYIYAQNESELYVHLFIQSQANFQIAGQKVKLEQTTNFPWEEEINFNFTVDSPTQFTLALRIPGWCHSAGIIVNGQPLTDGIDIKENGYVYIDRVWHTNDTVSLKLSMPVEQIVAHPKVRQNAGRIALQRGPLVYCLEEIDNGKDLNTLILDKDSTFNVEFRPNLLGGISTIYGVAHQHSENGWEHQLYKLHAAQEFCQVKFSAIPYAYWTNRGNGEMLVWINKKT